MIIFREYGEASIARLSSELPSKTPSNVSNPPAAASTAESVVSVIFRVTLSNPTFNSKFSGLCVNLESIDQT